MIAAIYGHRTIVEYFINFTEFFTREQRIDAIEVLGASLIIKYSDFDNATMLWFQAFEDRFVKINDFCKRLLTQSIFKIFF